MKPRDIFLFCVTCFLALTVTNAGIFLNDEWMSAAQLTQIGQGHQFTYNEGTFGYFANGTAGTYMETRNNVLMYSITLPLVALPMFLITSLFVTPPVLPIVVWTICGLLAAFTAPILTRRQRFGVGGLIWIAGITSILICPPVAGDASAVIAIVTTNILLYGGFAVLVRRIIDLLIEPNLQWYAWMVTMASSTLLFWAGTGKDHMLVAFVVLCCCYYMLHYGKTSTHLIPAALCAGLTLWIRTEVGVFIILAFIALLLIYRVPHHHLGIGLGVTGIGTIPFFVNNLLVSGNLLTPPFLMANAATYTDNVVDHTTTFGLTALTNLPHYFNPVDGLQILLMPASGALGLIVFGIALVAFIRRPVHIDRNILTLVGLGIASFIYYLVFCGFSMHMDTGIMPDIRYASAAYAPVTLAALGILTRLYPFDARNGIRTVLIGTLVAIPLTLIVLLTVPMFGASYPQFNHLINLVLVTIVAIVGITMVGMRRNPQLGVSLIAVTMIVWQIVMCFVYGDIKVNGYPYMPVVDWLHHLLFVW